LPPTFFDRVPAGRRPFRPPQKSYDFRTALFEIRRGLVWAPSRIYKTDLAVIILLGVADFWLVPGSVPHPGFQKIRGTIIELGGRVKGRVRGKVKVNRIWF
jgi:hypothetical protein